MDRDTNFVRKWGGMWGGEIVQCFTFKQLQYMVTACHSLSPTEKQNKKSKAFCRTSHYKRGSSFMYVDSDFYCLLKINRQITHAQEGH